MTPNWKVSGECGDNLWSVLNGRIYRAWLIAVVMGVIVFAFSLGHAQGPLGSTLAPDAFSPANSGSAYGKLTMLAKLFPHRPPGSTADKELATFVADQLGRSKFVVSTQRFTAQTAVGPRTLENVTGVLAGQPGSEIVVVAHRDSLHPPAASDLSGTAVLLQLANVLSGETLNHSIVLASISGSAGAAGATELAREIQGPVDAVIVLGDLAGSSVRSPVVVPWSNRGAVAPTILRSTLAAALSSQAQIGPGQSSLAAQFMHLAFPLATSEQSPFVARGEPAVLLSTSGDRAPAASESVNGSRIDALGRTTLETITALDGASQIQGPSAYLLYAGNVVPSWAVSLLVLALILPVLAATVDGLARARRRGHWVLRWVLWVLSAALPFGLAVLGVLIAKLTGLIGDATPGPVFAGVPMHGAGVALLIVTGSLVLAGFVLIRPRIVSLVGLTPSRSSQDVAGEGATAALMAVLCAVALAVWVANPFAAVLLVPALHLWMWAIAPVLRPPRPVVAVLALAGIVAPALAALYCATALGVGPIGLAWAFTTLLAGGAIGVLTALELAVVLGCVVSFAVIALAQARQPRIAPVPVTVRGPITYAGPGSLGGTRSALRR